MQSFFSVTDRDSQNPATQGYGKETDYVEGIS